MNIAQTLADTWGMHGDVGAGWMILMMAVMVLFWGAIIFGIVWFVRAASDGGSGRRGVSPIEVLERRFAEGAISVEDYNARRAVLVDGASASYGARRDEPLTAPRAAGGTQ